MTRDDRIERLIEDYVEEHEGHTPLPDAVRDAIRAELRSTRQRPAWWPRPRFFEMNSHMTRTYGIAAAAVIAAGAIALNAFSGSRTGSVASPTPAPSVSPSANAATALTTRDVDTALRGGQYTVGDPFATRFDAELPPGWVVRSFDTGEFTISGPERDNGYPFIGFYLVDDVYIDPCHPEKGTRPDSFGRSYPGADLLVRGLTRMKGFGASPTSRVVIGNLPATQFRLWNEIDTEREACSLGQLLPMFNPFNGKPASTNGGTTQEVWVVEDPALPVLIVAERGRSTALDDATIHSVLASLVWKSQP